MTYKQNYTWRTAALAHIKYILLSLCVCVCVHACVYACVRVCTRACVCVCVRARACVRAVVQWAWRVEHSKPNINIAVRRVVTPAEVTVEEVPHAADTATTLNQERSRGLHDLYTNIIYILI